MNLTSREQEILQHLCKGLTSKEVAALCHLSPHTIISHRKNLYQKLDAKTGVELGVKAVKYNLISKNTRLKP